MKKVVYLFIGFLFVFILAGCGSDGEAVEKTLSKLKGYNNGEITMTMEIEGKENGTAINMNMVAHVKEYSEEKMFMTMSADMGIFSVEDFKTYYEKKDGKLYMYTQDYPANTYTKQEVKTEDEEDVLTTSDLDTMLTDVSEVKEVGSKEIDGKDYTKYKVTLNMEALKDNAMFNSTLESAGEEFDEDLFNEIDMYLYIDTKNNEFKRIEMDFLNYMKAYLEKNAEDTTGVEITKFYIYIDLDSINTV
jgi:hypothetical protein